MEIDVNARHHLKFIAASLDNLTDDILCHIIGIDGWNPLIVARLACTCRRLRILADELLWPRVRWYDHGLSEFWSNKMVSSVEKKRAFLYFEKAAEQRLPDAQFMLGMCFYDGIGVAWDNGDDENAIHWFEKAADQGHPVAKLAISHVKTFDRQECEEHFREVEPKLDQQEPITQFFIGLSHFMIFGFEDDKDGHLPWFEKSAEGGYWRAECEIGLDMMQIRRSVSRGFEWLLSSAAHGFAEAQYQLAFLHRAGFARPLMGRSKAREWATLASLQGHQGAITLLEDPFFQGSRT